MPAAAAAALVASDQAVKDKEKPKTAVAPERQVRHLAA
jgi:hypothetical protein